MSQQFKQGHPGAKSRLPFTHIPIRSLHTFDLPSLYQLILASAKTMAWGWVFVSASLASWTSYALLGAPLTFVTVIWVTVSATAYRVLERRPPPLAVGEGPWKDFLCTRVPALRAKLSPTPWLLDGRLHTAIASLLSQFVQPIQYRREVITLKDGGEVALDWLDVDQDRMQRVVALVLPGLTGDSNASYIRASLRAAHRQGITCAVFNNRGLGGVPLKNTRTFCACCWEDVKEAAAHIRKARPEDVLVGLGFSMGGLLLTQLAVADSEDTTGQARHVDAVVAVSMPWDVHCTTRSLSRGVNRFFSYILARGLQQILLNHRVLLQSSPYFSLALQTKSVHDFDAAFTAPHLGFRDVKHYYDTASVCDKVHRIQTPLLAINAADDPFLPTEGIPVKEATNSRHVAILVPPRGGHLGFMEGLLGQSELVGRVWDDFLAAVTKEPHVLKNLTPRAHQVSM